MRTKRASLIHQMIMHLILVGVIFAMFFMFTAGRVNSKDIKQQVLEKQLALLIDSSNSGTVLSVNKINLNGFINDMKIEKGRVFVYVDDFKVSKGYPYFSKYDVYVTKDENKFYIHVG